MQSLKISIALLATTISMNAIAQFRYPPAIKKPVTDIYFDTKVEDPYRWLEDDRSAETKTWVDAQNKVTQSFLAKIPYKDDIKKRLQTLWNYEKFGIPFRQGSHIYYYKNDGLQNQSVLYREDEKGNTEVFLDPNKFSADGTSSLDQIKFNKGGSLAAYTISEGGSDWRKVVVIDTKTKQLVGDTLYDVKFTGLAWNGSEGFYYSSYDKPKEGSNLSGITQHHKLFYHKLGTAQKEDELVFGGEKTPRRYIGASITDDGKYLVIDAATSTSGNELYIKNLEDKEAKIITVIDNFKNEHTVIDSKDGVLYIYTNLNAPNGKVVIVDAENPSHENWKDLIPETKNVLNISKAGGKLFAQYLKDATSYVEQYTYDGKMERSVELPGIGTASGFAGKQDEKEIYFSFTSYIMPSTIYKYEIETGKTELYKKSNVLFDADKYESKQVFYTSKDGTKVPMIITHKKGLKLDGKNPTMLYGYGGFNVNLTPAFSTSNIILLEQGGVYAVPNLRGGGEYGEEWHSAGTKMKKQNVFDDFMAAAQYLIDNKYTSSSHLAISGGSNGGLLVGACMTQQPQMFKVAFPAVGVLDMLRYNKFTAGAGWAYDYGTAEESKEMFEYLYNYSPYHALKQGTAYPATMVTTADHDDRVVPAHSFKFAARLQEYHAGKTPVLIRIETNAGHGAGKPTGKIIEEQADKWSFMFYNMGVYYKNVK